MSVIELEKHAQTQPLSKDKDWWRGAVLYQIYPRSFADSNGDGIGDLKGILNKLPYIANLGADAIWISPFMKSPMDDFGYDVSDYRDVDPMFGSLADFKAVVDKAHDLGMRVLIDLVISHSSDQHPWFKESRASRDNAKADWYVWADAKPDGTPPNNWLSIFGGSAWQWDTGRQQYYMHNFLRSQPDLNFHNPDVQDELLDVARFWLDMGVDGFRLDTVNFYVHDKLLRNNPPNEDLASLSTAPASNPYSWQYHLYDKSRPENLAFLERLRSVTDEYENRTMVGEIGSEEFGPELLRTYTEGEHRLHMSYVFDLLSNEPTAAYVQKHVADLQAQIGGGWACWALSNHDVKRMASRLGANKDAKQATPTLLAMLSCLRGTPCIYQGEELAFTEADVPFELLQDPYGIEMWPEFKGRDGCRTPMAWKKDNAHGGFTEGTPWLPVAPEHVGQAAEAQVGDAASPYNQVRAFFHWRRKFPALRLGELNFIDIGAADVLALERKHEGHAVLCLFNLSDEARTVSVASNLALQDDTGFSAELRDGAVTLEAWQAAFLTSK